MTDDSLIEAALIYHSKPSPGKIFTGLKKPVNGRQELSLTYTPGVGAPCMAISKNEDLVWGYTNRGNTVAIISDGSAVLGLGDIGPEAGLPVMEGKAVLFKKFADIDSFPLCLNFDKNLSEEERIQAFIKSAASLEPSLGGINLEDIKAPRCFQIQNDLDAKLAIPVFHDDQDGTAIIIVAAILNALELAGKSLKTAQILINGAGAAGIACAHFLSNFGAPLENIFMCDSKGLLTKNRNDLNATKLEFAKNLPNQDLAEIVKNKDVFIGVSRAAVLSKEMVESMAAKAIVFAVANPVPEIMPEIAHEAGVFVIGTGRSDYPNQINNSLGFPGLFRAALDTRSKTINLPMKIAASKAIAELSKEPIPEIYKGILKKAYPEEATLGIFDSDMPLNVNYVLPKQFDLRVVPRVARAVAHAAMESGAAMKKIEDLNAYEEEVFNRVRIHWDI